MRSTRRPCCRTSTWAKFEEVNDLPSLGSALVTSSFPLDAAARASQRTRWEHGHLGVIATQVPRLGAKTYEQAAGFLRVMSGDNPLDASAVHPEAYPVVERILADLHKSARDVIGQTKLLQGLSPAKYTGTLSDTAMSFLLY